MIQRPTKVFPFSSGTKPKKRKKIGTKKTGEKVSAVLSPVFIASVAVEICEIVKMLMLRLFRD